MKTVAVENFLSSIDLNQPMINHFRNAMRDALIYKWDTGTRMSILMGIEDAYKNDLYCTKTTAE